jgi:hypothetical protein
MANYIFSYDYFSPKDNEGNLLLDTREARIFDAIKLLTGPEDTIELHDDVKKCNNKEELRSYIEEHDKLKRD